MNHSLLQVFLFCLIQLVVIARAIASESFFHVVEEKYWCSTGSNANYRCPQLKEKGFTSILTREMIEDTANIYLHGRQNLVLLELKIPAADPLLKWEFIKESEISIPQYYGEIPRAYLVGIYDLKPDENGNFSLPKELVEKYRKSPFLPGALVGKFLRYHNWQNTNRLYKLQKDNFLSPKVRLQWWYFDFFLNDSSTMVLAFIPQTWWDKCEPVGERESLLMISHITKNGKVRRFSTSFHPSELVVSSDKLEISSRLLIQANGSKENRKYSIQFHFSELDGVLEIKPQRPPFAPFPTGVMPGIIQTMTRGARWGGPSFSYVSQVPDGMVSGFINWDEYHTSVQGHAYHEQGRLDDTPEAQGGNWAWYHFSGEGWNIFGTPGAFIYIQKGDQVLRSGFQLVPSDYGIRNRAFSNPEHAKILSGAEIYFHHKDVGFKIRMSPSTSKALISNASSDPNQIWATVGGPAQLSIQEGTEEIILEGRMLLETCSLAKSKIP